MKITKKLDAECKDSTVFWFVRLEKSRETQDHERAAEAIRELRRLGVNIKFGKVQR